jgi:hypothetical protein
MIFRDREDAGRQLAAKLERYRGEHPIVMALPRGGVPVGFEVARSLEAPLDVLVVRSRTHKRSRSAPMRAKGPPCPRRLAEEVCNGTCRASSGRGTRRAHGGGSERRSRGI